MTKILEDITVPHAGRFDVVYGPMRAVSATRCRTAKKF